MVSFYVVKSGVYSRWDVKYILPRTFLLRERDEAYYKLHKFCTVYTSLFFLVYHVDAIDGEYVHGTFQGKEVCHVWMMENGRSGR